MIIVIGDGPRKAAAANLTLSEQIQAYGVMAVPGQSGPRRDDAASTAFTGQARQAAEKALANNKNLEARIATEPRGSRTRAQAGRVAAAAGGHPRRSAGCVGLLLGTGNLVLGILIVLVALVGPLALPEEEAAASG